MDLTAVITRSGRGKRPAALAALGRFARDESGVIVAFSIYFMLMILFVGALGVDVMRYESERSRLQHVLDQAVLAAADLDQTNPPAQVVADYFVKSNLPNADLLDTAVQQGPNFRVVSASARATVPTQLSHMLGVENMSAPARATAEERFDSMEISLVLDISGSMEGNRLDSLRPAAVSFVDAVIGISETVSVSLVPYSNQVALSPELMGQFNTSDPHDYSYCLNFEEADFNTTAMTPASAGSRVYEQVKHFDATPLIVEDPHPEGLRDTHGARPSCSNRAASQILPLSRDRTALYGQINALERASTTSIDMGVKWGAALLDPSLQPAVTNLIASNTIDPGFAGRPVAFGTGSNMKLMVVMSDGQNTTQYRLRDPFRSGLSDVFYNASTDRYAVLHNGSYYSQTASGDHAIPASGASATLPTGFTRLSFERLFATASLNWINDYLYANLGNYDWSASPRSSVGGNRKDSQLDAICTAAKNQGVIIYTIGFQAPIAGLEALRACASTESHFFDVRGLDIEAAFAAIAQSITQLKLTQ
ncbi:TadE/TadG family type IV pilus assembly protein [uncultured Lentibacter sp.]|jgi:Flp pilus assembly protein TadG|uniref:TadE/TadG family type IV pilus assembly protein n=1 Tax=uncultured Lentibacter sp. TaxID=1659309 RepID=UPI00261B9C03|nr:TadE/TadG family type IV pilus assembly protein [uncultured Lentibacter sp.]